MEPNWRTALITSIAPIAWGATYYVTQATLPADTPMWGAALRSLPAGLILLAIARTRPHGGLEWARMAILGLLNVGAFFVLVYLAAQLLPSSVAASIMAASPLVLAAFAWALASQRPTARLLIGSVIGILGVMLLVAGGAGVIDPAGVAASVAALVLSSLGYVLSKRWGAAATPVATSAWQLIFGGGMVAVTAAVVEGAPPVLDGTGWLGLAFITLIGTALANVAWFHGLERLSAGTVGIVGLLNPVTGVLLGVLVAGERLEALQAFGIALVFAGIVLGQRRAARPGPSGAVTPAPAD